MSQSHEGEGRSGSRLMDGLREKLQSTKLHDAKIALHHKRFALPRTSLDVNLLTRRV